MVGPPISGCARVALQTHLISSRYASIACCVAGLEVGPSVGTPKSYYVLLGLTCVRSCRLEMLIQLEKKADQTTSSRRSWVGSRTPGARNDLSRLIDGHLGLHARALVSR